MIRQSLILAAILVCCCSKAPAADPFFPPLYVFENGLGFGNVHDEAAALKQLGYAGIAQVQASGKRLSQRIAACDQQGLRVLSVYLNVNDQAIAEDAIKPLANRDAIIELTVQRMTPRTIEAVRQTAEMASQHGLKVALYPHHGLAVATMPQAMDLIKKVDHPNLGVMFNLCHFLRGQEASELERTLEEAGDRLFAVSVCGADTDGKGWGDLIQTLDQGDFPQQRLLKQLREQNFQGPVSLQCYAIPGDKRVNLQRSINAWKSLSSER
ncbi:MAG: hypothetical protein CBB71_17595 [Rhodopirellula sp. TMED11]|nr:MAG: hypothetical protein CBB71_17595 [Rhodopirellula sp. TMED11]